MPRTLPRPKDKADYYARFRPRLNREQIFQHEKLLAAAKEASAAPDSPSKKADEAAKYKALADFYQDVALGAADAQLANTEFPEDEDIWRRFPDVDPRGHYSEMELSFVRRKERIEALLQMRSEETRFAVKTLMDGAAFKEIERRMQEVAKVQRRYTRAEKLADHSVQMQMHTTVAALTGSAVPATVWEKGQQVQRYPVVDMEKAITGLEYLVGIRRGPLTPDVQQFFQKEFSFDLAKADLAQFRTLVRPSEMVFRYPDFESQCAQRNFSKPEYWDRSTFDVPPLHGTEMDEQRFAYSVGTAMKTLDTMFGDAERLEVETVQKQTARGTEQYERHAYDRADLLIIGGKTAREILAEEYAAGTLKGQYEADSTRTFKDFQDFYDVYGHEAVADLVGNAMLSGEHVEAFIPHGKGGVFAKGEPVQLTQMGFERSKLSKVELNGWEKFWNRFGFFKEKKALADEYASFTAARERVKLNNLAVKAQVLADTAKAISGTSAQSKREFFGDQPLPKNIELHRKYNAERSAMVSFAAMKLIIDGYPIEKVFDPAALQAEKLAAGNAVLKMFRDTDDIQAEAKFFRDAATAFPAALNKFVADHPMPDGDVLAFTRSEFIPLRRACAAAFDLSQEVLRARSAFAPQDYDRIVDDLSLTAHLGDSVDKMVIKRQELITGKFGNRAADAICDYLSSAAYLMGVQQAVKTAGKGTPFTQALPRTTEMWLDAAASIAVGDASSELGDLYEAVPAARDMIRHAALTDDLMRDSTFKINVAQGEMEVTPPDQLLEMLPMLQEEPEASKAPETPKAPKPKTADKAKPPVL